MNKDLEHLRLLSIFHYVVGGLLAIIACIPFIHLSIGIAFLSGAIPNPPHRAGEPDFPVQMFGLLFTIIPAIFILLGWTLAICTIIAGRKLSKHKSYIFCFVIAAILCAFTPFGTVLGVFTILVLLRDSVKSLFNGTAPTNFDQTNQNPPSWN